MSAQPKTIRLAVAQTIPREDPRNTAELRACGSEIRQLMRDARDAGARLIHFPEGATCWPHKQIMSSDPEQVAAADWSKADWATLQDELGSIAALAGELRLWTVIGAVHRLTPPHRPHNSQYVISDRGAVVTRYDERLLSSTKVNHMYTPGTGPITFEVDGIRFGCAVGMEVHFPEIFAEYERLDVDGVLFSTAGPGGPDTGRFALAAQAAAAANSYWVSYAGPATQATHSAAGVLGPDGSWLGRCEPVEKPSISVVDLDDSAENLARPWRRIARSGIYDAHVIADDPRSLDRSVL